MSGNLTLNKGVYSWWSFTRDDAFKGDGCGNAKGPVAFTVSEEVPSKSYSCWQVSRELRYWSQSLLLNLSI